MAFDNTKASAHNKTVLNYKEHVKNWMKTNDASDGRIYPRFPIPGVGAVIFNSGRLLLVKRGNEPSKGKWSIPGGVIELGETVYEAAKRETLEECSISIEIEKVLDTVETIVRDEEGCILYHYVIIDMLAKYTGGELKARSDAADCGWFTPAEAAAMDIIPTLRTMLKKHGII